MSTIKVAAIATEMLDTAARNDMHYRLRIQAKAVEADVKRLQAELKGARRYLNRLVKAKRDLERAQAAAFRLLPNP